ncbi:MAG: hypothetical protein AAFO17_15015 [Pseudomonadota bacterium]
MPNVHSYTKVMAEGRIGSLKCLHGMLENDPVQHRDQFSNLMKATFGDGSLDPRSMANDLGFSASTVYRWVEGKSAPHRSLWPRVQEWLLEAISAKVATLEAMQHDGVEMLN